MSTSHTTCFLRLRIERSHWNALFTIWRYVIDKRSKRCFDYLSRTTASCRRQRGCTLRIARVTVAFDRAGNTKSSRVRERRIRGRADGARFRYLKTAENIVHCYRTCFGNVNRYPVWVFRKTGSGRFDPVRWRYIFFFIFIRPNERSTAAAVAGRRNPFFADTAGKKQYARSVTGISNGFPTSPSIRVRHSSCLLSTKVPNLRYVFPGPFVIIV